MAAIVEHAPAKINLTLKVRGRRADGYHELESLIAFASVSGDIVRLEPGTEPALHVSGPFAGAIAGPNLVETALKQLAQSAPQLVLGQVGLEKHLPVAAGIGGGSADAAALLRAVRRVNPASSGSVDWLAIAQSLGADVPVCLEARAALIGGIGEKVLAVEGLPQLDIVLVNPQTPVAPDKTARVFASLKAPTLTTEAGATPCAPHFAMGADLIARMRADGNDLARAARQVMPDIAAVDGALAALPGVLYAGLSGAGPTSFAVFASSEQAMEAVSALKRAHPGWWVAADTIGGEGRSTSR